MQTMVITQYGSPDVLQRREVEKPVAHADRVLVKVHATSVNYNALIMVTGKPFIARLITGGARRPKYAVPGNDIAGVVEAVGPAVKRFKPGDEVYGDLSEVGYGAFAEYVAVPEGVLSLKPTNLSFEEATAVPEVGLVALQGLRDAGRIQPGHQVLINGASGGIGTFAVQLARHFGAEVTAVCSGRNAEMVRALGADHVIDYTREDFARGGQRYDLILATAGYRSLADYRRALTPKGVYVAAGGSLRQIFAGLLLGTLISKTSGQTLGAFTVKPNKDLDHMTTLLEAGTIRPVIDRCYPLSEAAEAERDYSQGRTRGKVVISMMH